MAAIGGMEHFLHYHVDAAVAELRAALDETPHVGLALYDVEHVEASRPAQQSLHALFDEREAPLAAFVLRGDEEPWMHGDLIAWPNTEAWIATGEEVVRDEAFAPMFGNMGEPIVFSLFAPAR